jgi:hypothetical protein
VILKETIRKIGLHYNNVHYIRYLVIMKRRPSMHNKMDFFSYVVVTSALLDICENVEA